jgi:CSLREA domain-containing protein
MPRLWPAVAVLALALGAVLLLGPQTAQALTITVDTLDDAVAADGDCSLREAIENANDTTDGDAHDDCAPGDPDGEDEIVFSVAGTIVLDGSELPSIEEDLVIDGDGEITIDADGASRHLQVLGGANATVTGVTFFGGHLAGDDGGSISVLDSSLVLVDCILGENVAQFGGAISILGGALTVSESSFTANGADEDGGAIAMGDGASTVLTNVDFINNAAVGSGGAILLSDLADVVRLNVHGGTFFQNEAGAGGAIFAWAPFDIDSGATFNGNTASGVGGAIAARDAFVVTDSAFDGNDAMNGGAIHIEDSSADITRSTFTGNAAVVAGGAIYSTSADGMTLVVISESVIDDNDALAGAGFANAAGIAAIVGTTVSRNSATGGTGGGISNGGGLEIANSTISTNAADQGGGGLANSGEASVMNTSFVGNAALDDGAGIRNENTGTLAISNSLVALGNAGDNCAFFGTESGTEGSNLADDDSCDSDLFVEVDDLELGPLADNGGPTLTHRPADTSPAVDGGDDAVCLDDDQRGEERIALEHCDVGAVEVQDIAFVPTGELFLPNLAAQVDHQ